MIIFNMINCGKRIKKINIKHIILQEENTFFQLQSQIGIMIQ